MDKVFVGKIVNTHGIKGEIRIKSDFDKKNLVFVIGNEVIIDNKNYIINSYRVHKDYDMITLKDLEDINLVIPFKGENLFIRRDFIDTNPDEYILDDLIGMEVTCNDDILGIVKDYQNTVNPLIIVNGKKDFYIPLNGDFIIRVDKINKQIFVKEETKGLII